MYFLIKVSMWKWNDPEKAIKKPKHWFPFPESILELFHF